MWHQYHDHWSWPRCLWCSAVFYRPLVMGALVTTMTACVMVLQKWFWYSRYLRPLAVGALWQHSWFWRCGSEILCYCRPLAVGALMTTVAACIMIMTKMVIVPMFCVPQAPGCGSPGDHCGSLHHDYDWDGHSSHILCYFRPLAVGALVTTVAACIMIMTKMFIVLIFCVTAGPWLWEHWWPLWQPASWLWLRWS